MVGVLSAVRGHIDTLLYRVLNEFGFAVIWKEYRIDETNYNREL